MPENQSSRLCAVCGDPVNGDCYQKVQYRHKACHNKTKEAKRKASMYASREGRKCAHCGGGISIEKNAKAKYCSDKCRDAATKKKEDPKKKRIRQKEYYDANKDREREKARERMRAYLKTPEGIAYKQRRKERGRKRTPAERSLESSRRYPHNAHVKAWRRLHRGPATRQKHCAHVSTWKNHLKANPGSSARYFKSIGQPWRNPHLTSKAKFRVQYKLDPAFKLYHVNKAGWRRDELAARNDGTVNFWELMSERKTCPYCGTKFTKENAVADHMDPMKHGGANGQHNLTICCRSCNTRKSGRPFVEWLEMLPDDRRNAALLWYKRKHGHGPEQSSLCFEFKAA